MPAARCIITLLAACFLAHAAAGEVRLVTVEYPPYYGPELPNQGPITEVVATAYGIVGYQVDVEFMPWVRAMDEAKAGRADGLLGGWYSKERERWFVFSDELPGNKLHFYKRKGTAPKTFTSYADLTSYTIGTVRGYRNPPEFDAAPLQTDEAHSDKVNLIKLANGRVDLVLIDRAVAEFLLGDELTRYAARLEAIQPPIEKPPLYVLISKKADNYEKKLDALNEGLKILKSKGAIRAIMERHGMM